MRNTDGRDHRQCRATGGSPRSRCVEPRGDHRLAVLLWNGADCRAKDDGEEDQREQVHVRRRLDGVPGYDPKQRLSPSRGVFGDVHARHGVAAVAGRELVTGRLGYTRSRLDDIGQAEADGDRDRGGRHVVGERLAADPAQLPEVTQGCRSDEEAGHDEWDHDHRNQVDERGPQDLQASE